MEEDVIIRTEGLTKYFKATQATFLKGKKQYIKAVDNVNLKVFNNSITGLIGESGCGKTTLGKLLLNLIKPDKGKIFYKDCDLTSLNKEKWKKIRAEMQAIFQDPFDSLSPWLTVSEAIGEPLRVHRRVSNKVEESEKIKEIMELVQLTPCEAFLSRYPHELSGGERQRVVIARSVILQPKFIVADEPTSMLDASIRIEILNLLRTMKRKFDLSLLFITHDLAAARYMCDFIYVMYLGKIVEVASSENIINHPLHPYSEALFSAVLTPDPKVPATSLPVKGIIEHQITPPRGCTFHPRCPFAKDVCKTVEPELGEVEKGHFVACHLSK
jgi:oligopeptide/dipeptide ABC transporter ATP-binding protein